MNGSIKVIFNKQRISRFGISSLYIRVKISGKKKEIPLDIRWPVDKFDHENGLCRHRFQDDHDADDHNMMIRSEIAKMNEIFKYYRLSEIPLTMNKFLYDYKHNFSKKDFIQYMEKKIRFRMREREIIYSTYLNHLKALRKIKAFQDVIMFSNFDENWALSFDNYLKKTMASRLDNNTNSRWTIHKVVKTYLRQAMKDNIKFIYPYHYFTISSTKGNWRAIFEEDLKKLYEYYKSAEIPQIRRSMLRAFLFSCMTGLRISDLIRVNAEWNMNNILTFVPFKNRKKNRILEIPLNKIAKELFNDAIRDHRPGEKIFNDFAEQYANRVFKDIAMELGIKSNIHFHVGRHTFITLYYNKTKDLLSAKEFAGHENIRQTEAYTHQNREEMRKKMRPMDKIF